MRREVAARCELEDGTTAHRQREARAFVRRFGRQQLRCLLRCFEGGQTDVEIARQMNTQADTVSWWRRLFTRQVVVPHEEVAVISREPCAVCAGHGTADGLPAGGLRDFCCDPGPCTTCDGTGDQPHQEEP